MTSPMNRPADLPSDPDLDQLMPMHLRLDSRGTIQSVGPTLVRVIGNRIGQAFDHVFRVLRPAGFETMDTLTAAKGVKLSLALVQRPEAAPLRGQAVPDAGGGVLLNLSFGIGVVDAVRHYGLTVSDFSPTDLTVELLYLVEAKNAVLEEFRRLSLRLEGARSQAEEQAMTDTLTGLRNRRALDHVLDQSCALRLPFGLMHLDLDRFKQVNDTFGHEAGDEVLVAVAAALRRETRLADTVARVGGDEFVLILPELISPDALLALARRLIARLEQPIRFGDHLCQIGGSIGIVVSTDYDTPISAELLRDADLALYAAKHAGRGQAKLAVRNPAPPPRPPPSDLGAPAKGAAAHSG